MGYFSPVVRSYLTKHAGFVEGRLLDVGCGTSPYKDLFKSVSQYVGIDRPSEPYEMYKQKDERKGAINVVGSAYQLPFRDASFDAVLGLQILEHLAEPIGFLLESYRVLRNGGIIILTFPLINPVHEEPYDFYRYTQYGLQHLCSRTGLEIQEVTEMGGGWLTVGYLLRSLLLWEEQHKKIPWWRSHLAHYIYRIFARYDCRHPCPEWTLNYFALLKKA